MQKKIRSKGGREASGSDLFSLYCLMFFDGFPFPCFFPVEKPGDQCTKNPGDQQGDPDALVGPVRFVGSPGEERDAVCQRNPDDEGCDHGEIGRAHV